MKKYLLDTNICIFFLKEKYNVKQKAQAIRLDNCYISEITLGELLYGAECSLNPERNLIQIEEFVKELQVLSISTAIALYAKEKSLLRKRGAMIDDLDILIGATAIANNMILVTDNEKHLNRLANIKIENWVERD